MENDAPSLSSPSSRPSIGFALGSALLVTLLFCASVFFTCCLFWEKLASLLGHPPHHGDHADLPPYNADSLQKPEPARAIRKTNQPQRLPVLMPGDHFPTFIAMACPWEQQAAPGAAVIVQKPTGCLEA